jgi:hypothetical protein
MMLDAVGRCNWRRKVITTNVEAHKSDREYEARFFTRWLMPLPASVAVTDTIQNSSPKWKCCYAGKG